MSEKFLKRGNQSVRITVITNFLFTEHSMYDSAFRLSIDQTNIKEFSNTIILKTRKKNYEISEKDHIGFL